MFDKLCRHRDLNPGSMVENHVSWTGLDDDGIELELKHRLFIVSYYWIFFQLPLAA